MSSDKEDMSYLLWMRRIMKTIMECWAHLYCNTCGELGSSVVARELGQDSEIFR
jgi:hypothetical protein